MIDGYNNLVDIDSCKKELIITFPNGDIPNITDKNIILESFKLKQSMCYQSYLKYGRIENSMISFSAFDIPNIKGRTFNAKLKLEGVFETSKTFTNESGSKYFDLHTLGAYETNMIEIESTAKFDLITIEIWDENQDWLLPIENKFVNVYDGEEISNYKQDLYFGKNEYIMGMDIRFKNGGTTKVKFLGYGEKEIDFGNFIVDSCTRNKNNLDIYDVVAYTDFRNKYLNSSRANYFNYIRQEVSKSYNVNYIFEYNAMIWEFDENLCEGNISSSNPGDIIDFEYSDEGKCFEDKYNYSYDTCEDWEYDYRVTYDKYIVSSERLIEILNFIYNENYLQDVSKEIVVRKNNYEYKNSFNISMIADKLKVYVEYDNIKYPIDYGVLLEHGNIRFYTGNENIGKVRIYIPKIIDVLVKFNDTNIVTDYTTSYSCVIVRDYDIVCNMFSKMYNIPYFLSYNNSDDIDPETIYSGRLELEGYVYKNGKPFKIELGNEINPSESLYPTDSLYPKKYESLRLTMDKYINCWYDDEVKSVFNVVAKPMYDNISVNVHVYKSTYYDYDLSENEFVSHMISNSATYCIEEFIKKSKMKDTYYHSAEVKAFGNPFAEVGDIVTVETRNGIFSMIIMERTLSGFHSMIDEYICN